MQFQKPVLVYIPTYNVRERVIPLIDEIPQKLWDECDVVLIDNHSTDGTFQDVVKANNAGRWPKKIHAIQPDENLGYAGSQKLAYQMVLDSPKTKAVVMLHGDGQYSPLLVEKLLKYLEAPYDVVYGYRSWRHYWSKDETPISSYVTIKFLSLLESLLTGYFRREWHSGFVMYKRSFLESLNFNAMTKSMHMDGHMLFAAGKLKKAVKSVPIFKRYKNYPALSPTARVTYVFRVLGLMPRFHFIDIKNKENHANRIIQPDLVKNKNEQAQVHL